VCKPCKPWHILIIICLTHSSCNKSDYSDDLHIRKGEFTATLTETGELQAVMARSVIMPSVGGNYGWQFKITGILEHGSHVKEGDSIIQIDPGNVMKYMIEQLTRLDLEKANLNKLVVEQKSKTETLKANLQEIQADYDMKMLELEKFEFESERNKQIKELEFNQARINLERVIKTIELEEKISENALKIQKIRLSQIENNIRDARAARDKLTIRSPIEGVLQISTNWNTQQLYKSGDETWQGAELARVPDLRRMKVISAINEMDIGKICQGQKVVVRLEAFPEKAFQGKIYDIGKLSHKKEWESTIKVFDYEIILDDSDPVLKPGMTVNCEIFYAVLDDVHYVDNSCLERVDGNYFLYTKNNGNWERLAVEIGPGNSKHTVIYGDFKEGTELMVPNRHTVVQNL
jgi:multidrug resistance efflux pump